MLSRANLWPFYGVKEVLGDFVYVEKLISGEGDIEAAA